MKKVAIYCPFYISHNNNMLWIESWKSNVLKYVNEYDVYYSVSYPTNPDKWDVKYDKVNIIDKIPNISLPNCMLLFNEPNIEHKDALNRMHKFAESKYEYLVHIEQDVTLNNNIIPLLIDNIEKNNKNMVITNTIPIVNNGTIDFDMSVFAVDLKKIKSHSDLYNSILCDLTHKINIFDLHEVNIDSDVKAQYKKLLYTLFKRDDIYINYEKYLQLNPFNDSIVHAHKMKCLYTEHSSKNVNITIPIYFDMGRKLVYDNFISDKLSILDNTDNILFTHMGHSRYTIPIQPTSILSNNINGDKNIIEVNNDIMNKQYPKQHQLLILNNNQPVKNYAIYCPFYITKYNAGYWITNWLRNVADKETAPIYYSISYANDVDITSYSDLINDLNNVGICIFNEPNITHSNALKKAHIYLCDEYDYMIHIEQDVILQSPICNHLINTMINNNSDIVITDIESNILWDTPSDIDISIFAINLTVYDSNNYNTYFNTTDITPQLTTHLNEILHIDFNVKPPLLNDKSDIHTTYLNILDDIYIENKWWLSNISKLTNDWLFITNLTDITFVDVARTYIIDAYINNKLSIIKGVQTYAKHLKQSRYKTCNDKLNMDNIISIFGYPPHECKSIYIINNIDIVIISQNQCDVLSKMVNALKFQLPDCKRIFVLDRCSDNSSYMLSKQHEFFIERHDAVGFCAGTARNLGLQYTNPNNDVLFLDGDRIPHNINIERLIQMLYYFDISLIKNKVDIRKWFDDIPTNNINFGKYDNGVWSSALLLRRSAINSIKKLNNFDGIFNPIFDGNWGGEDEYLGDMCKYLNMKCGGFPNFIYVDGDTTIADESKLEYKEQTEKRNKLRSTQLNMNTHQLIGNQPYLSKKERRELVDGIITERRNVIRNMIKHRDR